MSMPAGVALYVARVAVGLVVLVLLAAAVAMAQDPVPPGAKGIPTDVVPAWIFYWSMIGCTAIGAVLSKVVQHLWTKLTSATERGADDLQKANERLHAVQVAHTAAVERLKQESADFGREAVKQLAVSTEAIEDLTAVTNQLLSELQKVKSK